MLGFAALNLTYTLYYPTYPPNPTYALNTIYGSFDEAGGSW